MALLYADENFNLRVVEELRRLGHDVQTAQQAGQAHRRIPDPQVLTFAIAQGRALLTFNMWHFVLLHNRTIQGGGSHRGIVACTPDNDVAALARRIDRQIAALPSLINQLVRVYKPSVPPPLPTSP
jgi:hypothetical protein